MYNDRYSFDGSFVTDKSVLQIIKKIFQKKWIKAYELHKYYFKMVKEPYMTHLSNFYSEVFKKIKDLSNKSKKFSSIEQLAKVLYDVSKQDLKKDAETLISEEEAIPIIESLLSELNNGTFRFKSHNEFKNYIGPVKKLLS